MPTDPALPWDNGMRPCVCTFCIVSVILAKMRTWYLPWSAQRWGDALSRLRSYPLTTLKSPTLGMGSVGDVARALGVNNSKVRSSVACSG